MSKKIVVTERDYDLISKFVHYQAKTLSTYSYLRLLEELKEAKIVTGDQIPKEVIGLNSEVSLYENTLDKKISVTLVLPGKVDAHSNKISIFSPLGIILIGYRKGDSVEWEVHGKIRQYKVLQVNNPVHKK